MYKLCKDFQETNKNKQVPGQGKEGRSRAKGSILCTGGWMGDLALCIF